MNEVYNTLFLCTPTLVSLCKVSAMLEFATQSGSPKCLKLEDIFDNYKHIHVPYIFLCF